MSEIVWNYDPTIVPRLRAFVDGWELLAYVDGCWAVESCTELPVLRVTGRVKNQERAKEKVVEILKIARELQRARVSA